MVDDTDGEESPTDGNDTGTSEQRAIEESRDILDALAEYDDSVIDPEAERFGVLTVALTENPDADDGSCESLVCVEAESDAQKRPSPQRTGGRDCPQALTPRRRDRHSGSHRVTPPAAGGFAPRGADQRW